MEQFDCGYLFGEHAPDELECPNVCRFLDAGNNEALGALS